MRFHPHLRVGTAFVLISSVNNFKAEKNALTNDELEELMKALDIKIDVLIGHITLFETVHYFAIEK